MNLLRVFAAVSSFVLLAGFTLAADLKAIPRTLVKEPAYRAKPKYCLLVFGPEASTRVWLIEDGETLYVDRDGNGDLTDPGEVVQATDRRDFGDLQDQKYFVGTLTPDRSSKHTQFKVSRYQEKKEPPNYVISGKVNGVTLQYAGWDPIFADSPSTAPIIHFGSSLVPQAIRVHVLKRGNKDQQLHLRFGTAGLGKGSFASLGYPAIPEAIRPIVEIEWPSSTGQRLKTSAELTERC